MGTKDGKVDTGEAGTLRSPTSRSTAKANLNADPGWLGPFNRFVWAYPNSILYVLLVIGAVAFFAM